MTLPQDKTIQLVAAAKAGDRTALDALYRRYQERMLAIVRLRMGQRLRSRMDSQDLVQSVMLESLQSLDRFEYRTEGAFLHWLSRLVENKIRDKVDYLTAQKRDIRRELPDKEEIAGNLRSSTPTPSGIAQKAEEMARLEEAIEKLSQDQRDLIIMHKLEGMSYEEIAEATEKTPESVRKALARSLAKLASELSRKSA